MSKMSSKNAIVVLFFMFVLILFVEPNLLPRIYSSILGRFVLILLVLFFAMNNVTLGLLSALFIIITSNMYVREGLDNMTDSADTTTSETVADVKEKKSTTPPLTDSVDLETIKNSIQSKDSSSLPITKPVSTDDVTAASTEAFSSMYSAY